MSYCTLFDCNYLDKGIVMIDSLMRQKTGENIYILCMDSKTSTVLQDYYDEGIVIISKADFFEHYPELYNLEKERTRGELCWSCTALIIKFILTNYKEKICTYVDSDICFYSNPAVMREEMENDNCSVQVVPHNFPPNVYGKIIQKNNGKNCVQFNTFTDDDKSLKLLDKWIQQCMTECSVSSGGDQRYTSEWGSLDYVNESKNLGAGVATWNISRFVLTDKSAHLIKDRYTKKIYKLVFYHFHQIVYTDRNNICVHAKDQSLRVDNCLADYLYCEYIYKTEMVKRCIKEKYGFEPMCYNSERKSKSSALSVVEKYNIIEICSLVIHKIVAALKKNDTLISLDYVNMANN